MDVGGFLRALQADPGYAGQIVHVHTESANAPRWAEVPAGLHPLVGRFLAGLGIERFYSHQAEAVRALLDGEDVLVTTGAASGKSLCYQVPILEALLKDPGSTALLLFPTKALAHDQVAAWNRGLRAVGGHLGLASVRAAGLASVRAATFDGDASQGDRRAARNAANVIVTNPEMLHAGLLPHHDRWSRVFRSLRFVVLDEVHTYTGFFGANMANVMRRLERVCAHYGSRPQVVSSSATAGNARETAELVTGRRLRHIARDGAPHGAKTYLFWNPPRIKDRSWRGRRSANVEAHELMVRLLRAGVSTIVFSKARNTAEMIYRYVRETLQPEEPDLAERVIAYRGGYSAEERREMERRLREGELLGVSATRALELGIDVGSLDACIIVGWPGTLTAFFQQAGRAGRARTGRAGTRRDSLVILVGIDTAINQYVMAHPEYVFARPLEAAVVDRDNPFVVLGHLRCATAELPVAETEAESFGYAGTLALEVLEEKQKVLLREATYYHAAAEAPAYEVRLRGYGDESTVVVDADSGRTIDRLDKFRALRLFYPGAIYLHRGDTYALVDHDTERNVVRVRRADVSYYTDPVTGTAVDHVDVVLAERPVGTGRACLGEVFAVQQTPQYEKVHFYTLERISQHATEVPPQAYEAMAFWVTVPEALSGEVARLGLDAASGMKGVLYCVSRVLPLFLTSDANDFDWSLGSRNTPWHTMFWYEFFLQGIGHAEQAYERLEEILDVTLEQLLTCDCEDGCPNCTSRLITPYHVRNIELGEGWVASRRAAAVVLDSLLSGRSAAESLAAVLSPREKRGMRYLPTVTGERRRRGDAVSPGVPPSAAEDSSGTSLDLATASGPAGGHRPVSGPHPFPLPMGEGRVREPHRLPLDERLRQLMLRKLERARSPRKPVDHPIDLRPPVGTPVAEAQESLRASDAAKRAGAEAIRHSGDPTARGLRQRLRQLSGQQRSAVPRPRSGEVEKPAAAPPLTPASQTTRGERTADTAIRAGDPLARLARQRRSRDRKQQGGKAEP